MYANEVETKEKEKLPESLCGFPVIKRQSLGRSWSKSSRLSRSSWKSSRFSRSSSSLVCFASYTSPEEKSEKRTSLWIQLFRERLSSKVHATIPQSIVGGFEFTACSPKKFQRRAGKGMDERLQVLKPNKSRFDSYSVRNSVLIISHITFRDCHVHTFFRQPFSK